MTVFKLRADRRGNKFRILREVAPDFNKPCPGASFNGQSLKDRWEPLQVRVVQDPRGRLGDLVYFDGNPMISVFTCEAVDKLADLLEPCGELLPLTSDDGEFLAYNVTTKIDALNEEASEIDRSSAGLILRLHRPVFKAAMQYPPAFKIPQIAFDRFVSEAFEKRVRDEGLEGFDLQPCDVL